MIGGEIIAVSKAAETVGKKALAEDEKTKHAPRPEYLRLARQHGVAQLNFDMGLVQSTDFGRQFLRAVTE